MKRIIKNTSIIFTFIVASCSTSTLSISDSNTLHNSLSSSGSEPSTWTIGENLETFWQPVSSIRFKLLITSDHLELLNTLGEEKNGIYNDVYIPINLQVTFNEVLYEFDEVGIRMKGNIFSRGSFLDQGVIIRPFHFRLRFNETFDDEVNQLFNIHVPWQKGDSLYDRRKARRLFGLSSLEFKWNRSNDPSLITQVFGSNKYQEHGVIAPRSTLSEVHLVNNSVKYQLGIFTIHEPVDEIFIARHFQGQAANGDLYKALFPVELSKHQMGFTNPENGQYIFHPTMVGIENTLENYHPVYDLKTNKKSSQHEALNHLISTLDFIKFLPHDLQFDYLKSVVDINSFLKYAAVSYLIGNPDDMRNNKNNTYIYFHGENNLAHFIPYDLDWSLGVTWDSTLTQNTSGNNPYSPYGTYGVITNPLYWYTIFSRIDNPLSDQYPLQLRTQIQYREYVSTWFNSDQFSLETYETMMLAYQSLYEDSISSLSSNSVFMHSQNYALHINFMRQAILSF
jgi:spore coat protein CotH